MTTEHSESITRVIQHTVARARERGLESHEQWKAAADAVRVVRPDLAPAEVLRLVERVVVG